jgi:hypothetical protein
MGDATRPPPISPPCGYRSTRPLRRHPPFWLERNHLFSLYAPAHLGTIMSSSLGRAPPHPPPRNGDPAFLYSCRSYEAGRSYVHRGHKPANSVHKKHNTPRNVTTPAGGPGPIGPARSVVHPSAWKVYSPNFRFTAFSEVRHTLATPKQQQRYAVWTMCHTLLSWYATFQEQAEAQNRAPQKGGT